MCYVICVVSSICLTTFLCKGLVSFALNVYPIAWAIAVGSASVARVTICAVVEPTSLRGAHVSRVG